MNKYFIFSLLITIASAAQKIYEVLHFDNCKGDQPMIVTFTIKNGSLTPNKSQMSGYFETREKVPGPIEFSFESNRCDFSMNKCEKFSTMKVNGICDAFKSKNGMFEDAIKAFSPRPSCPLMPGKYIANETLIDLAPISMFPTEGFLWMVTLRGMSGDGKNKKLALCLYIEAKIYKVKERKGKN